MPYVLLLCIIANTKISVFVCQSKDRLIFILMKTKHHVYIMVLGVIIINGKFMPLVIYLRRLRLSSEAIIERVEAVVLTRCKGCW